MKAIASGKNGSMYASVGVYGSSSAKITKHKRDVENEEIRVYLSKLKRLVPFMPKNRRLSKLEVIQYVIDYISDLQQALESHPTISSVAVHSATAAAVMLSSAAAISQAKILSDGDAVAVAIQHRQPLTVLSTPNTSVPNNANTTATAMATTNFSTCTSIVGSSTSEFAAVPMSSSGGQTEKFDYACKSGSKSVTC